MQAVYPTQSLAIQVLKTTHTHKNVTQKQLKLNKEVFNEFSGKYT